MPASGQFRFRSVTALTPLRIELSDSGWLAIRRLSWRRLVNFPLPTFDLVKKGHYPDSSLDRVLDPVGNAVLKVSNECGQLVGGPHPSVPQDQFQLIAGQSGEGRMLAERGDDVVDHGIDKGGAVILA
jgi:hypothetical protein